MDRPSVPPEDGFPDTSSRIVEYGFLYVLLLVTTLAQLVLSDLARMIDDLRPFIISPRLFGTLVYSILGIGAVAVGYVLFRQIGDFDAKPDRFESARGAIALFLLFLGSTYFVLGRVNSSGFGTMGISTFLITVIGMGLPAIGYLRIRGVDLQLNLPNPSAASSVLIATIVPVLIVLVLVLIPVLGDVDASLLFLRGRAVRPVEFVPLFENTLIASVFSAVGMGLFYHGAIQETVRENATPIAAVVAVTILDGLMRWSTLELFAQLASVPFLLAIAISLAVVVLLTAFGVSLWRALDRNVIGDGVKIILAAVVGVGAITFLVLGWHFTFGSAGLQFVGYTLGFTATIGVGAVTYERTRSVWVPMLAILMFEMAVDLTAYL